MLTYLIRRHLSCRRSSYRPHNKLIPLSVGLCLSHLLASRSIMLIIPKSRMLTYFLVIPPLVFLRFSAREVNPPQARARTRSRQVHGVGPPCLGRLGSFVRITNVVCLSILPCFLSKAYYNLEPRQRLPAYKAKSRCLTSSRHFVSSARNATFSDTYSFCLCRRLLHLSRLAVPGG
ncbi:hypothetical protein F5Y13DRAFT_161871 [Hypoxylon sp. FL1857]|nr:hypothetical protein F5Y13DRAFT_161871 [Hypoxylon sp. FL1857]